MTEQPTDVLRRINDALDESLERLFALLRIPSVSTDPAYAQPCRNAADWLQRDLSSMGFEASTRPTQGHPMVVAHWREEGAGDAPHVLFYGHYDVQPADPLELWETPPFEPRIAESPNGQVIVARGACDDKGQLMTFVEACRAWIAETGGLPVNVTVLLEGEEESGSKSIGPFLEENREELAADLALVCDTGMWDRDTPAITTMLRGLVYEEVTITAADRDLHSGLFGGAARNPIQVLARILASLHDETGHVTIPGFYDGVQELPEAVRQQWTELGFDAIGFLSQVGLAVPAGETERSVVEQIWSRPTCEFNGIVGGYIGEGAKTVIPSKASAKVSFRLVGEQDPRAVSDAFRDFVRARLPSDCTAEFSSHGMSPALQLPFDSPYLDHARDALQAEFGRPAALIGSGGSIPIVGEFKRMLGMDTLLIGFGLDDDRVHSPNEKYDLESFRRGARSWARVLGALASG